MSAALEWGLAALVLAAALVAMLRRNPFQAGLALLICALGIAGLQASAGAWRLAAWTATLASVWTILLALFAVMTASLPETGLEDERVSKPGLVAALFFGAPLLALCFGVVMTRGETSAPVLDEPAADGASGAVRLLIACLLAAAIVGASILSRRRS